MCGNGHSCSFVEPSSILFAGGSPVASASSAAVWLVSPAAGFPRPARPAAGILNPGIRSIRHFPLSPLSSLFLAMHHCLRLGAEARGRFPIHLSLHSSLITYMGYPKLSTRPRPASQRDLRRFHRTQVGKLPTSQKFCLRPSAFIWYKQFTESSVWLAGRFCRNSRARPASKDV